jgi:hypothetical protein
MLDRSRTMYILGGALLGVIALAAFRIAFIPVAEPTHYHANFALFAHGERIDLSADEYMEDVATCAVGETVLPTARAHLHNNNPDVAHVHHEGVTWGHLLANLGFGLGEEYLVLDNGPVLTEGEGRTLKFILNGRPQFAVHNELIRSGDRLLISYGLEGEAEVLQNQFPRVATTAEEYNRRQDPAGCAYSGASRALTRFW